MKALTGSPKTKCLRFQLAFRLLLTNRRFGGPMFQWLRKILSFDPSVYKEQLENEQKSPLMDEGSLRSGPEGYSPNTAYPESFYGSMGDPGNESPEP